MAAFLLDGNSEVSASQARAKFDVSDNNLKTEIHKLRKPVPVHLVYMTAWIDEDGATRFGDDIYNRDEKLIRSLKRQEGEI